MNIFFKLFYCLLIFEITKTFLLKNLFFAHMFFTPSDFLLLFFNTF